MEALLEQSASQLAQAPANPAPLPLGVAGHLVLDQVSQCLLYFWLFFLPQDGLLRASAPDQEDGPEGFAAILACPGESSVHPVL